MYTSKSYSGLIGTSFAQFQHKIVQSTLIIFLLSLAMFAGRSNTYGQTIVVVEDIVARVANPNEISINTKLYPNPACEKMIVELEGANQIHSLRVLDLSGRIVKEERLNSPQKSHRIDVKALSAGTYILWVKTEAGSKTQKFSVVKCS